MSAAPTKGDDMGSEHMFAHRIGGIKGPRLPASFPAALLALLVPLLLLAGCGGSDGTSVTITGTDSSDATANADPDDLKVIEGWATALKGGDVDGAAGFFAVPSTADNGGFRTEIKSDGDAVAFNESLPCGAEVIAAETDGDVTTATFELSDRPGGDCGSGAGGQAATAFKIENGKIVEWRRVEVPGGGEGGGAPPATGDQV
jgi:hypothetical protein